MGNKGQKGAAGPGGLERQYSLDDFQHLQPQDAAPQVSQMTMNLQRRVTCTVCYDDFYEVNLIFRCKCSASLCNSCFAGWWKGQIKANVFNREVGVNAYCPAKPVKNCDAMFTEKDVEVLIMRQKDKKIANNFQEQINLALLERYLIQTDDIRTCPKQGCAYAGSITTMKGSCYDNLVCQKCKHSWKDPLHFTKIEEFKTQFNDFISFRSDSLNNLSKLAFTEPCPNPRCGYYIEKSGGCSHMQCEMCKHQFCWRCLGEYYGYKHSVLDNGKVCGQRAFVFTVLASVVFFILWMKVMQATETIADYVAETLGDSSGLQAKPKTTQTTSQLEDSPASEEAGDENSNALVFLFGVNYLLLTLLWLFKGLSLATLSVVQGFFIYVNFKAGPLQQGRGGLQELGNFLRNAVMSIQLVVVVLGLTFDFFASVNKIAIFIIVPIMYIFEPDRRLETHVLDRILESVREVTNRIGQGIYRDFIAPHIGDRVQRARQQRMRRNE